MKMKSTFAGRRILSSPGKRAYRSSSGECDPVLLRMARENPIRIGWRHQKKEKRHPEWVMFLAENLKSLAKCEHRIWPVKRTWAKPKPLYKQKRARVKGEIPSILALFVFIDELTLTHHELALPWFLASLHELNCNQRAVRHNSCHRQFTKAQLSIHAT